MRAVLCGANGAMGHLISGILGGEVVGRVSLDGADGVAKTFDELGRVEADVIIDFSHHSAAADVLRYAKEIGAAAVIGTTGHTEEEKRLIFDAAKEIPVFYSGNMSIGIALLCQLTRQTVALFPDAVSERGLKHLGTLKGIVAAGERAAMFYCIQRPDVCCFGPADMIDPAYAVGLRDAVAHGVEVYPHLAVLTVDGIGLEADCLSMV